MKITKNNNLNELRNVFLGETKDENLAKRIVSTLSSVDSSSAIHENISEKDVFDAKINNDLSKIMNVFFIENESALTNVKIEQLSIEMPFYFCRLLHLIKLGEVKIFCNPEIEENVRDSLNRLSRNFDLSNVDMYSLVSHTALNPDKTISKKKIYSGSGFALHTIQNILNENEHFEFVSITSSETPQQTLDIHEMSRLHNTLKKKSEITCEVSYVGETSEHIPVCIDGVKRIVKKSTVSDLDLFREIENAKFACSGNFFVSRQFFGSFADIPLKKVRRKKDKKIFDHIYSDLFEQFYNCNFVINSIEDTNNISSYFTIENLEELKKLNV